MSPDHDLPVSVRPSALGSAAAVLLLSASALLPLPLDGQSIVGRVYAVQSGDPIEGAEIRVRGLSEPELTDGAGLFKISGLPVGHHVVAVHYLGLDTREIEVDLSPGESVEFSVGLEMDVIPMPEIFARVHAGIPVSKLYDFYRRKETGHGHFITREEIAKHPGRRPTDILRQVPGLDVATVRFGNAPITMGRRKGCVPDYFVDGIRAPNYNVNYLQTIDIAGIEVYRGHSEIPVRFKSRAQCGVIVLWTRDPSNADSFR